MLWPLWVHFTIILLALQLEKDRILREDRQSVAPLSIKILRDIQSWNVPLWCDTPWELASASVCQWDTQRRAGFSLGSEEEKQGQWSHRKCSSLWYRLCPFTCPYWSSPVLTFCHVLVSKRQESSCLRLCWLSLQDCLANWPIFALANLKSETVPSRCLQMLSFSIMLLGFSTWRDWLFVSQTITLRFLRFSPLGFFPLAWSAWLNEAAQSLHYQVPPISSILPRWVSYYHCCRVKSSSRV